MLDFDQPITLEQAAAISGLSVLSLRNYAGKGLLRTEKVGRRLSLTTRRWLDEYLSSRQDGGRPPKPLPDGYIQPPPRKRKRA